MTADPIFSAPATDLPVEDAAALLARLRRAGFAFKAEGGDLHVTPAGQLDDIQRQTLKAAKPQILDLLRSEARPAPRPAPQTWTQLPPAPPPVCCGDCRHSAAIPDSDPVFSWRRCGLGIDGGGGFARQDRHCARFLAVSAETPAERSEG